MTRQRTSQYPPRDDPETTISRQFTLPTARTFTLAGSASLSALIPDDEVDRLVGRATTPATTVLDAYSSGRLPGDVRATASATVDGNPTTAWQPGLGSKAQVGSTLTYDLAKPQALSSLAMQVIADGRHSVPTAMTITSGNQVRSVTLPPIADGTVPGAVTTVPVSFPALTGSHFVVTFTGVRPEYAANYYSAGPLELPLGIAEIGIPGVRAAATPATLPGQLRGQPPLHRRPADRRRGRRIGAACPRRRRGAARPLRARRQGHHARRGTPRRGDRGRAQPAVRQRADHLHRLEHRSARARLGAGRRGRVRRVPDHGRHPAAHGDPARSGAHGGRDVRPHRQPRRRR